VLLVHTAPLRDGPLGELLQETDEPPHRQGNQLPAIPDRGRRGHEGDSSVVGGQRWAKIT
jgi:hypothetical protein